MKEIIRLIVDLNDQALRKIFPMLLSAFVTVICLSIPFFAFSYTKNVIIGVLCLLATLLFVAWLHLKYRQFMEEAEYEKWMADNGYSESEIIESKK